MKVRQQKSECYVDEWHLQPASLIPEPIHQDTDNTINSEKLEWGKSYSEGDIVLYEGKMYRVMQDTVASENYKPSDDGMLAIYMIYRGSATYEWLYGEYVEQTWVREYEDIAYECMTATAGANVHTPDTANSVWRITIC